MTTYHVPGNEKMIDELYAVLSKDENGEGIVAMINPDGGAVPLVFGYEWMLAKVQPAIKKIAEETGQTLRVCKFSNKEILQEIKGSN